MQRNAAAATAAAALLLLLAPAARAAATPKPAPAPAPSEFARAVAAIQGPSSPGDGCPLKLSATAVYKEGTATVSGTLTVSNPTSSTINVFNPPTVVVKSVVPKAANGSPAVKALLASSREDGLRQFRPYSGPYFSPGSFDYVMAIYEAPAASCFAGASMLGGQAKGVPLAPGKSVACAFSVPGAVVAGTDPGAVVVSAERLVTAASAKALAGGDSRSCAALAKVSAV